MGAARMDVLLFFEGAALKGNHRDTMVFFVQVPLRDEATDMACSF